MFPMHHGHSNARVNVSNSYTLMSGLDAGLIKAMEDAVKVLRHASQPLGPMGAEWLERQARAMGSEDK